MATEQTAAVTLAHRGARLARATLALNLAVTVASLAETAVRCTLLRRMLAGAEIPLAVADHDDARWNVLRVLVPCVWGFGCAALVLWLGSARRAAAAMKVAGVHSWWQGVAAFLVPGVNLVAPYVAVRDLQRALDPMTVPEAPARPRSDGTDHYRQRAVAPGVARESVARAPIAAWWMTWLAGNVLGVVALVGCDGGSAGSMLAEALYVAAGDALVALSLVLALVVVGRLDGRVRAYDHAVAQVA